MSKHNKCFNNQIKDYVTEEDVKLVVEKHFVNKNVVLQTYSLEFASEHMLGFLCDYLKLTIHVRLNNKEKEILNCFTKCISKSNEAKAAMVKELKLFDKELIFYTKIKERIQIPGIKPWSPQLISGLKDAMVFENLNTLGYRLRNKLKTFDEAHTLQALDTLARFHASTIIYEETKSRELNLLYSINDEFEACLDRGGYEFADPWYVQCMYGALEVIKSHSKYAQNNTIISICMEKWPQVWKKALDLADFSPKYRNVICHRDLWNNNILFRYTEVDGKEVPNDCLLVDFQAVRCHPPAGDIMLLLYCNLEKEFREKNLKTFLNYYYCTLERELINYGISINKILNIDELYKTAEEYRLWSLVTTACLVPQFWMDDELTTKIFTDSAQFGEILCRDKATFIKKMIDGDANYRVKVLDIFEEIVAQYCLRD